MLVHDFFIFMQQKFLSSRNYLRAITLAWLVISLKTESFYIFKSHNHKLLKCDVSAATISFSNTDEWIQRAGKTDRTCLLTAKFAQIVLTDLRKKRWNDFGRVIKNSIKILVVSLTRKFCGWINSLNIGKLYMPY